MKKLWFLLTPGERRGGVVVLFAELLMALGQVMGIASVLPFLTLVANPDTLTSDPTYQRINELLHLGNPRDAIILAGIASLVALVLSNCIAALTAYFEAHYVSRLHQQLQFRLMRTYLARPYEFFLNRNSAELGKNILEEVSFVVTGVVVPVLQIVSNVLVALFIIALLALAQPLLGLVVLAFFGALYAAAFLVVNRFLVRIGRERVAVGKGRFQAISESFAGVKDVKAHGYEQVFLGDFDTYSRRWAKISMQQTVTRQTPRFMLEIFAFGGIIAFVLYFLARGEDVASILPMLGLYAFGSYRLMPSLHRIYEEGARLRGSLPALDLMYSDSSNRDPDDEPALEKAQPLEIQEGVSLDQVRYRYPGSQHDAVSDIDIQLERGAVVAFVGGTGAGKTTLIDLILGLLQPSSGNVFVDGSVVDRERRRSWQACISYVPQQIFLADNTVAANIGFGLAPDQIDRDRMEAAARAADIYDFVSQELPQGFDTNIGEQGMRLSGGQRQRIGIARALYRNPAVLVLDEATSALDSVTEDNVIRSIRTLSGSRLVVMIAHRISTVRHCDTIFVLDHGRVVDRGTFDELIRRSALFRSLAQQPEPVTASVVLPG